MALKGLGFALTDSTLVLDGGLSTAELRGMLLCRRGELETELADASAMLERVEQQVQRLENSMSNETSSDVVVDPKPLPAAHLAVASAISPSFASTDIGPVIQPLFPRVLDALRSAGVEVTGASIAFHTDAGEEGVRVHAAFPVDESVHEVPCLEVVDLPPVELAATAIHHGDMSTVDVDTVAPLFDWIRDHGFRTTGFGRERYLACPEDLAQ